MPRPCTAKMALRQGLRPNVNYKVQSGVCLSKCIFCDIWRLATLVATHVPFAYRYSGSPFYTSNRQSSDFQQIEKRISSQFQIQQVQLAGIMSMCTFDDAISSQGFRKAYIKCFTAIQQLLCEEADLEDRCVRPCTTSMSKGASRDAGCGVDSSSYHSYEPKSSRVGLAV